jgi:hypothetical protein
MQHEMSVLAATAMSCPECLEEAPSLPGSTVVLAWYVCEGCGHFWSARVRNGRPVQEIPIDTSSLTSH